MSASTRPGGQIRVGHTRGVGSWELTRERGSASAFHARAVPDQPVRSLAVLEVDAPALVLGSTQPASIVDQAALDAGGVELVRRRSGGGAVLLRPDEVVWVDVVLPSGDPLWDDDVARAFHWLGRAWCAALGDLGVVAAVHEGGLVTTRWSPLVCFAGLGPGEVTVGGAKAVGIAQRRTRDGARFQCALLLRWEPAATTTLLSLDERTRAVAEHDLAGAAAGVAVAGSAAVEAFLARLPG